MADVWKHIEFDSFPIFWLLVLRAWSFLTGGGDFSYRLLGLGIGVGILAALWFNSRVFKISFPVFSIALLGFSPAIIQWGDSMRGYGLGICAILFTFGLVWKAVELPSRKNIAWAALGSLIAAQTLYYNTVLIFAICLGGFAVAARKAAWRHSLAFLLIGGVSAVSLLPYLAVFERSKSWAPMFQYPELWQGFQLGWYWKSLCGTLNTPGPWVAWVWIGLLAIALAASVSFLARKGFKANPERCDAAIFSLVALVIGSVGYYLFLRRLQYITQQWYYVALLAFTAVALDVLLSLFNDSKAWRIFRLGFLAVFVALTFGPVRFLAHTRMTNIDLAATWLTNNSAPGDLILVTPWYCGITFDRYYRAETSWTTIPPIEDHRFHRVDLLQNHMTAVDQNEPTRSILQKVEAALKGGHRVWIVGNVGVVKPNQIPPLLLPAPNEKLGWNDWPYIQEWSMQVAYFIQRRATQADSISIWPGRVNGHEDLPLVVAQGWNVRD
jgi:hypothetical protein